MLKKGALVIGLAVVTAFSGCGFGVLDENRVAVHGRRIPPAKRGRQLWLEGLRLFLRTGGPDPEEPIRRFGRQDGRPGRPRPIGTGFPAPGAAHVGNAVLRHSKEFWSSSFELERDIKRFLIFAILVCIFGVSVFAQKTVHPFTMPSARNTGMGGKAVYGYSRRIR